MFRHRFTVFLFLAALAIAQGFYAVYLQGIYYATQGPFYDSLAYYNELARLVERTQQMGVGEGLRQAVASTTVVVPFTLAVLIAPFVSIGRELGVWLQVPWVLALLVSGYALFRVRFQAPRWVAAVLALPLSSVHAVYFYNGGLSDFRMDLHLYLTFGCAVCWFALAIYTGRYSHWIVCGLFVGLAALCRATSPVYLAAVFLPSILVHVAIAPNRWLPLLKGSLTAALVAALASGWFFVWRFESLHYYYFVWNLDANAKLPFAVSKKHFEFAIDSVGWTIIAGCFVASLFALRKPMVSNGALLSGLRAFPWEVLFAAVMPAGFLALRGAGMNPFVSMPSSFGIVVLLLTWSGGWKGLSKLRYAVASVAVAIACLVTALQGIDNHRDVVEHYIAGYEEMLSIIERDATAHDVPEVRVTAFTLGYLSADALFNTLVFDQGYVPQEAAAKGSRVVFDLSTGYHFMSATYVDWKNVDEQSNTDAGRIRYLRDLAVRQIHYLLVPSDQTLATFERNASHNYINNYSRWLRKEILADPAWTPVSRAIWITAEEQYTVYRNDALVPNLNERIGE